MRYITDDLEISFDDSNKKQIKTKYHNEAFFE